jgi:hypothetical protein
LNSEEEMSETTHKRVGATFREFTKTMEAQQNQSTTNVFKGDSNLVDSPGAFTSRKINIVRDNKKGSTRKKRHKRKETMINRPVEENTTPASRENIYIFGAADKIMRNNNVPISTQTVYGHLSFSQSSR